MAPPPLPQEIIDNIIDEFNKTASLAEDRDSNKRTLVSLSMVARAWRKRSQKHLFSVLKFRNFYPTKAAKANLDQLGPVFSLTRDLDINGGCKIFSQFGPVVMAFLRRFRNLETLSITKWDLRGPSTEELSTRFRHFGETVTHLKLEVKATSESLIHLTSMFPRLSVLEISIRKEKDEIEGIISEEELPTTGSFQGSLFLWAFSEKHNDFLVFLSSTSPKFDAIYMDGCKTVNGVWKLLNSSAATLKSFELHGQGGDLGDLASLSECTQLRELSVSCPWPESTASLLQTVRSPHLEKLELYFTLWSHNVDEEVWMEKDDELCEAYDQWTKHTTGTIEVVFNVSLLMKGFSYPLEMYQEEVKELFPRFTEKATVAIIY